MNDNKLHVLAFYLPQFFPFKENDEWWGPGFTEWTNVAKAKPLYKGHYQPRIPADLGFYDLRVPEVREEQAKMAKEAGVTAFCYWHYWFGDGKRLLERVFDEVLETGKPDFPFCLAWANHSWYKKTWQNNVKDKLLIEQRYPGIEDAKEHFNFLLKAFRDDRYVKIDGKPFLFIFSPGSLPDEYLSKFNDWAVEAGYPGLYLVANIKTFENKNDYLAKGYSAVLVNRIAYESAPKNFTSKFKRITKWLRKSSSLIESLAVCIEMSKEKIAKRKPVIVDYSNYYNRLVTDEEYNDDVIPQIVPQWDHTPRSGLNGISWINTTPEFFSKHVRQVLDSVKGKKNKIIILKSWNEWGEGNYMEPDTKFGRGFLHALRKELDNI